MNTVEAYTETLQQQIDVRKREITTDGYPMSIGELSSLYKDGELDIHPEFQRFFRWSIVQKSKLIESIMLGIPIPSIFVAQREDGVWDVVDGLQRLSTIFEFMGILKKEDGQLIKQSKLVGTKYLPTLQNKIWEAGTDDDENDALTHAQKLSIKREKIDIKIVKRESHDSFKYELFQRLNTLGSKLSDQEVRNCLLVLVNKGFYKWLRELAEYEPYIKTLSLTDRLKDEQYNLELLVRFIVFTNIDVNEVRNTSDLGEFLTEKIKSMAETSDFNYDPIETNFKKTFDLLHQSLGDQAFNKYNPAKDSFGGAFLISAFEVIAIGLGYNIDSYPNDFPDEVISVVVNKVKSIWENPAYTRNSGAGFKSSQRVPVIVPLGIDIFKYEN